MINNLVGESMVSVQGDCEHLLEGVKDLIVEELKGSSLRSVIDKFEDILGGGKMLRARLTLRVGTANGLSEDVMMRAAAAVEMMHAASLLHDDVIDGGKLRRGEPAFWVREGVPGAILLGDLLVCKAIAVLSGLDEGRLMNKFIEFSSEMCDAEAEQELVMRGHDMDWAQTVSVARRKTGSLFAFAASAGAVDESMRTALQESGYAIGTAYQLADDILDAYGDVGTSDKTLGKDADREKTTAAASWRLENVDPLAYIDDLCKESRTRLAKWPQVIAAWDEYYYCDVEPTVKQFVERFSLEAVSQG